MAKHSGTKMQTCLDWTESVAFLWLRTPSHPSHPFPPSPSLSLPLPPSHSPSLSLSLPLPPSPPPSPLLPSFPPPTRSLAPAPAPAPALSLFRSFSFTFSFSFSCSCCRSRSCSFSFPFLPSLLPGCPPFPSPPLFPSLLLPYCFLGYLFSPPLLFNAPWLHYYPLLNPWRRAAMTFTELP